jgi:hypothetical protein
MTGIWDSNSMTFDAYLYQLQGTVNGANASVFPAVWFVYAALAMMVLTVVFCLSGSLLTGRKGQLLLLFAGILALLSMAVFGAGLLMSDYAQTNREPGALMNLYPSGAFALTADQAMEDIYHFTWWLSYGFWLTLVSAIISFVATVAPSLAKKTANTIA